MIKKLADEKLKVNLAVSLHSANNLKRSEIMDINNSNDLESLKESLIYFYSKTKIKITYEYVLLNDFNDNIKDAQELIQFSKIVPSKINLIEFNNVENSKFKKSTNKKTTEFMSMLKKENIVVNLRRSRGEDVNAACGQLANKNLVMLNQIIKPITKELKVFDSKYKDSLSSDVKLLILISDYILKNPGKKIRPILLLLVSKMIGDINNKTYSSCILIELLHTATLIHDDVVDDAHFRRGKFSVSSLWKNKIAVLVGDYLLSKGLSLGLKDNDINILKYTSKAVENISEGEIYQMQNQDLDLNEDEYFEIIKRKI